VVGKAAGKDDPYLLGQTNQLLASAHLKWKLSCFNFIYMLNLFGWMRLLEICAKYIIINLQILKVLSVLKLVFVPFFHVWTEQSF
jgi:hypothetical protein